MKPFTIKAVTYRALVFFIEIYSAKCLLTRRFQDWALIVYRHYIEVGFNQHLIYRFDQVIFELIHCKQNTNFYFFNNISTEKITCIYIFCGNSLSDYF